MNMASELQYRVFKELYDEESERYSDLDNRAKLFITIITFYLGAIAFKFDDVLKLANSARYARWCYLAIALVLVVALLFTIIAVRIRTFEGICDPEEVIENFGETAPSDKDFLDDRIADLAVATNRNSNENDRIASNLIISSVFIFVAATIQAGLFAVLLFRRV